MAAAPAPSEKGVLTPAFPANGATQQPRGVPDGEGEGARGARVAEGDVEGDAATLRVGVGVAEGDEDGHTSARITLPREEATYTTPVVGASRRPMGDRTVDKGTGPSTLVATPAVPATVVTAPEASEMARRT